MRIQWIKTPPLAEFGGFDTARLYQMVPLGGKREIGIEVDQACVVESENTGVASIANVLTLAGPLASAPTTTNGILLSPGSRVRFSIVGVGEGHTRLLVRDGVLQSRLLVSVKTKRVAPYAVYFLKDIRRSTTRSSTSVQPTMVGVRKLFLNYANVELKPMQPEYADVIVPRDLGNPLFLNRNLGSGETVFKAILDATPNSLLEVAINGGVLVYCSWDVEDVVTIGATKGNCAFVEDVNGTTNTFAHEIGHALGLEHHNLSPGFLMYATYSGADDLLSAGEIDKLNESGAVPDIGYDPNYLEL